MSECGGSNCHILLHDEAPHSIKPRSRKMENRLDVVFRESDETHTLAFYIQDGGPMYEHCGRLFTDVHTDDVFMFTQTAHGAYKLISLKSGNRRSDAINWKQLVIPVEGTLSVRRVIR